MTTAEVSSSLRSGSRRPGRRSIDTDLLRVHRLDVDLNSAELEQCQSSAAAAAMPLRRWARRTLLGTPIAAAHPRELRAIWSESSTLQSQTNQLVERLNQLNLAGELNLEQADATLRELAVLAPQLHQLVRAMRLQLASGRSE